MKNIDDAIPLVKKLRREYSNILLQALNSTQGEASLETEDLIRLIGHLQATYDHLLAAKAHDGDLYCVLGKHLPAALILSGEIGTDVSAIYNIMSVLTDGKVQPCSACKEEQK